jgi:CBS domain-containing protein
MPNRLAFSEGEPFCHLPEDDLGWLASRMVQEDYPAGRTVLAAGTPGDYLFFIESGYIALFPEMGDTALAELVPRECFPLEALEVGKIVNVRFDALQDSVCWRLKTDDLRELSRRNPHFGNRLAARAQSLSNHTSRPAPVSPPQAQELPIPQTLAACAGRPVAEVDADDALVSALKRLRDDGAHLLIVRDRNGCPAGAFGYGNLLDAVLAGKAELTTAIAARMSALPPSLPESTSVHEAAALMSERGIDEILVESSSPRRRLRVVSHPELLAADAARFGWLRHRLANSDSSRALQMAAKDIQAYSAQLLGQGVAAWQATQIVSNLSDQLARRVIEVEFAQEELTGLDQLAWIVMGSQGRHEQTLLTDQDNGIIFTPRDPAATEAVRETLLRAAKRVKQTLANCGIPLCEGGIMGGNPRWCLTLNEWKTQFRQWLQVPEPDAILNATIFFDLRHLWGDGTLTAELTREVATQAPDSHRFLRLLAETALLRSVPIGFFRDFRVDRDAEPPNSIDLKQGVLAVFVDAARLYALRHGIHEQATAGRLLALGAAGHLPGKEAAALVEAFRFLQSLRLRLQHETLARGKKPGNRVAPYDLNDLDRRFLLEALRQAARFHKRISLDFSLAG